MRAQRQSRNNQSKASQKQVYKPSISVSTTSTDAACSETKVEVSKLPIRPKGNYNDKLPRVKLLSNLYKVEFNQNLLINIYSLRIQPGIQHDSTKKLNTIINSAKADLKPYLGNNFVISGRTIYSCEPSTVEREEISVNTQLGPQKFKIILKLAKKVDMANIASQNPKESFLPLNFMNNLIKQFFAEMNYVEVGKCGKYVNPNSKYVIPNSGMSMFTGYEASILLLQGGLYLRVDSLTRIVQQRTALDQINSLYAQYGHLSKQEKRSLVQQNLIGKTVVANYGNSRHWRVTGIIFDVELDKKNIAQETNLTFTEYYKKNYGLVIKNKRQPVLYAKMNGKKKSNAILIPQFVLISGLPNNLDEIKRRQISQRTIVPPQARIQKIQALISALSSDSQNFSSNAISQSLGMSFSSETEKIDALSLNPPYLQLGCKNSIEQNKVASFALFNKPLYFTDVPLKIVAFIPSDYDFSSISKLFDSTCRNLQIKHDITTVKIQYREPKRVLQELRAYVEDKSGRFADRNFCWFILPGNMKNMYPAVKKLCINSPTPKLSQVALTSTLAKKGFASIITKILIQISSKIGNVPWAPKISKILQKKVMMIAIDSCPDTLNRKDTVVSYCSTLNTECTKFHTNYRFQKSGVKFNQKIKQITAECLAQFGKANNMFPTQLVFLQFGCSDSQKDTMIDKEISEIKAVMSDLQEFNIKLTYIIVDLSSKHKFFLQKQDIINPSYGTLINSQVVGRNYDFFLISQHCNRGTVKPVHYDVRYTDSNLEEGVLQQFLYGQCFNYMNWSGSVRVPGVMQYAKKLSKLVSQNLHEGMPSDKLSNNLFFI